MPLIERIETEAFIKYHISYIYWCIH